MSNDLYIQIGRRIRDAREAAGITQKVLGDKLSHPMTATAISLYENGEREPSLDVIMDIASVLNVSKDYLISGGDEHIPITPIHVALRADSKLKNNPEAQKQILSFIDYVKNNTDEKK